MTTTWRPFPLLAGLLSLLIPGTISAQERGPLTSAAMRAVAPSIALEQREVAESGWWRVLALWPGTEVTVRARGSDLGRVRVVRVDENSLTVQRRRPKRAETLSRSDVLEISEKVPPSDKRRALGLLGGFGGFLGGAYVGAFAGQAFGRCQAENLGCMGIGMMVGMTGGAVVSYRLITATSDAIIYRAP